MCADAEAAVGDRLAGVSHGAVLEAALQGHLSAFDAEFVALARGLDVPLVTTDPAILAGAQDVAVEL